MLLHYLVENQKTENLISQQEITKENCIKRIVSGPGVNMCLKFIYLWCYTAMHVWKIHDVDDLRKCFMQTWFDFDEDIIDGKIDQWRDCLWDHVYMLMVDTLNTCSEMNVHSYDSSEHFMKLSM